MELSDEVGSCNSLQLSSCGLLARCDGPGATAGKATRPGFASGSCSWCIKQAANMPSAPALFTTQAQDDWVPLDTIRELAQSLFRSSCKLLQDICPAGELRAVL